MPEQQHAVFIANTQTSNHVFAYRTLGQVGGSARLHPIPKGSQVRLSGTMTMAEVMFLAQQHAPYGMVPVEEYEHIRGYVPLVFSLDKPVPGSVIQMVINHNQTVKTARGEEIRRRGAVAMNEKVQQTLRDMGAPIDIAQTELSYREEFDENVVDRSKAIGKGTVVTRLADRFPGGATNKPVVKGRVNRRNAA